MRAIEPDSPGSPLPAHCRPWVLAATILGSSMAFINGSVVNVALPAMQASLGATVVDLQWVLNGYNLFLSVLLLLGGALGDKLGRRRVFLAGLLWFGLASLGCGLAPSVGWLVAARVLQGIGGALLIPGSLALLTTAYPREERGAAIGSWSGATAITAAAGPLAGGWLVDTVSWRPIFLLQLPLAALTFAMVWWRVPRAHSATPGRLDLPGAGLVTVGLGALTWALIESSRRGLADPWVQAATGAGLLLLATFLWHERRHPSPLMPLGLFRSSVFSGANGLTLLLYFSLGGVFFVFPLMLIQVQGYSATATGAAFLPFTLVLGLLSRKVGALADRVGPRGLLAAGPLLTGAGYLLMARVGPGDGYVQDWLLPMTVVGLGMALTVAPLTSTVMGSVDDASNGAASGINNTVSRVAGLLAVALLGAWAAGRFPEELATRLDALELAPALREQIMARAGELAGLELPPALEGPAREAARGAVREAFVPVFRGVCIVAAGACALSAACGLLWAGRRPSR